MNIEYLPDQQYRYKNLPELSARELHFRRELLFLLFAGLFVGTLAMLNILGLTRFIKLWEPGWTVGKTNVIFAVAVGVLPYPITFLCTDFISELYGRKRASLVVWLGLLLNIWVVFILWLGSTLPGFGALDPVTGMPPLPEIDPESGKYAETGWTFFQIKNLTFGVVAASMIAYLAAQFLDVHLFHFWKRLTNNQHLWLHNNGSTLISQLVDTVAVILITHFYSRALPIDEQGSVPLQLALLIATSYAFKLSAALVDTIPFYIGTYWLARYMRLPPPNTPPNSGALYSPKENLNLR